MSKNKESQTKRKLEKGSIDDEVASKMGFEWYVKDHNPQGLEVNFIFENPSAISASGEG